LNNETQLKQQLSWQLLLGFLVFIGMTLLLASIAKEVMTGQPLTIVDEQFSQWLAAHRTRALTVVFMVITALGSAIFASALGVVVGVHLWRRRQSYLFAAMMLTIFGGMLLNRWLKLAFQRTRPEFDDPIRIFAGYSFPSGHTMTATVVYGAVALLLLTKFKGFRERVVVVAAASLLIGLVAFSRIYLGAHYLTDVLAAIAEGLAWISLCFTLISLLRQLIKRKKPAAQTKAG
jgi:membrane-associated phospholipid phosphatase